MAILITEPDQYSLVAISRYRQLGEVWFRYAPEGQEKEVDVLVVRLSTRLDEGFLSSFANLKAIVTPTTSLTHIELDVCNFRNIRIFSLAQCMDAIEQVTSTSELTMGLIITLLRNIPAAHQSVVNRGEWNRDFFRSRQLSRLTLGIVGLGRIGGHVARYGHVFGMKVLGHDPHQPVQRFKNLNVPKMPLDTLLPKVDVLSIHANLNRNNVGLIGRNEICLLPRHALIINTARGALLDEQATFDALRSSEIGGAAVDVLADEHSESSITDSPLVIAARNGLNVIVTPHIGGCTADAMHLTEEIMADYACNILLQ